MAYAEGDPCWLVVKGDGGGVFESTVKKVTEKEVTITCKVGTYSLPVNGDNAKIEGAGGDEVGFVAERDDDFPEHGYHGQKPDANPPHAYAVVEQNYQKLFERGAPNQATVITGESGAGKSFTTNRMLDYLSAIGRPATDPRPPVFREPPIKVSSLKFDEKSVTDKLLTSTAIVEAFGNSKMPRNNDSSRFGKLYRIYFDTHTRHIKGCSITPYLLEKSRIVQQAQGERNYHAFYMFIRGLSPTDKAKYHVKGLGDYKWLNSPGITPTYDVDGRKDEVELVGLMDALSNFCNDDMQNVISCTMGVLRMGDIVIGGADKAEVSVSDPALEEVAENFGVEPAALAKAICTQTLVINNKSLNMVVSSVTAGKFNGSMAKSIYNLQFQWMVEQCSKDLIKDVPKKDQGDDYALPFIGVLDIFGFEFVKDTQLLQKGNVDKNSFEQWCINACNEKLQNLFVNIIVDLEKALYKHELGYEPELNFTRNDVTVELIFGKKDSVYAEMENVTMSAQRSSDPNANFDGNFLESVKKGCGKHPRMDITHKALKQYAKARIDSTSPGGFIVKHYAADVLYDPDGWVDKNQDKVTNDMKQCMAASKLAAAAGPGSGHLPQLYQALIQNEGKGPGSVLSQFRLNLDDLTQTLLNCETGFVRCIKPNRAKKPDIYEADLVLTQLAYTGMLATLRIQKAGYPVRIKFQEYVDTMRVLDPDAAAQGVQQLVDSINEKRMPGIIQAMGKEAFVGREDQLEKAAVIKGKGSLVLARDWAHTQLQIQMKKIKGESAVIIQSAYRACQSTRDYTHLTAVTASLKPLVRGLLTRLEYYPRKYGALEAMSRGKLTTMIRASMARGSPHKPGYYIARSAFFLDINRKLLQQYIQATVYRQWYYERKLKHMENENITKERKNMVAWDKASHGYMVDWADERAHQQEELDAVRAEEEYRKSWTDAKSREVYAQEKEVTLLMAEEARQRSVKALKRLLETESAARRFNQTLDKHAERLNQAATEKSRQVLIRMGVIRDTDKSLVAPDLTPLPDDDDAEGLAAYFDQTMPGARREERRKPISVELDSNVDVSQLRGKAKADFLRNIAKATGVDATQVKLVLGLETPRPE